MEEQAFVETLRRELPRLLRERPELCSEVATLLEEHLAPRRDLSVILEEIRALRADFNRMLERQDQFAEEMRALRADFNRMLERQERFEQRQDQFAEEMRALRADFNRKMDRLVELERGQRRMETTLGAIGTRWGLMAEDAFRQGLAGLVEERFGVKVERWTAYDDEGAVFGYPQHVEIDVAVQNGEHLLIELKASTSEEEVPTLLRKREFYAGREKVPARMVLISPFVYPGAQQALTARGVAVYTSAETATL